MRYLADPGKAKVALPVQTPLHPQLTIQESGHTKKTCSTDDAFKVKKKKYSSITLFFFSTS